tara:strand:- start:1985 stop:2908 length:924 start_codon:yes stop_codon:yes gene_type:complete
VLLSKKVNFIGACFGWGAQKRGCEYGPKALFESNIKNILDQENITCKWELIESYLSSRNSYVPVGLKTLPLLTHIISKVSLSVKTSLEKNNFPVVIGGDHSIAIGTWSALSENLFQSSSSEMGLLWIDAHLDAHTLETTPSKAYHGMPLAVLLGYGDHKLVYHLNERVKLKPENVVLIGVRSWEKEEYALLKNIGVTLYTIDDIRKFGFSFCFQKALYKINQNTNTYGLTFDLDAFDPSIVPGVGTPEIGGLYREEVFKSLFGIANKPELKALEIVELNPEKDHYNKTLDLLKDLLYCIFGLKGLNS